MLYTVRTRKQIHNIARLLYLKISEDGRKLASIARLITWSQVARTNTLSSLISSTFFNSAQINFDQPQPLSQILPFS